MPNHFLQATMASVLESLPSRKQAAVSFATSKYVKVLKVNLQVCQSLKSQPPRMSKSQKSTSKYVKATSKFVKVLKVKVQTSAQGARQLCCR